MTVLKSQLWCLASLTLNLWCILLNCIWIYANEMHFNQITINTFYGALVAFVLATAGHCLLSQYREQIFRFSTFERHVFKWHEDDSVKVFPRSSRPCRDHMIPPHHGNKTNSQVTMGQRFVSDIIRDLSVHIARQHLSVSIEMITLSLDVDPHGHTLWREVSRGKAVCVI